MGISFANWTIFAIPNSSKERRSAGRFLLESALSEAKCLGLRPLFRSVTALEVLYRLGALGDFRTPSFFQEQRVSSHWGSRAGLSIPGLRGHFEARSHCGIMPRSPSA